MKIIFLCGFLEPGGCGVGDYTRRLAVELIRQGHEIEIIAVNDPWVREEFLGYQTSDGIPVKVYRIPSSVSSANRFDKATNYVKAFDPEWISLQLVLFAFNNKGLPFNLTKLLASLCKGRRVHIMFHELWLGLEKEAKLKILLWGWVQKKIITGIIGKLKPGVVHTQTQLHQFALSKINVKANFLPLISNIPVVVKKVQPVLEDRSQKISFVIFGSIYYGAPITEFAKEAGVFAKKYEVEICVTSIGRNRKNSDTWIKAFKLEGIKVELLGEQPSDQISHVLSNASYGISTTPYMLAEKSGAVMAMREHGLTVICVSRPYSPRVSFKLKPLPGIREYVVGNLEACLIASQSFSFSNNVETVSLEFIQSLTGIISRQEAQI
jgi:glycosyltransferase involved in cell wall biosynthesis